MITLRVVENDSSVSVVTLCKNSTLKDLSLAVWKETGVPQCIGFGAQRLFLRGSELPLDGNIRTDTLGIEDGDTLQLVERNKRIQGSNWTYMKLAAMAGVRSAVRLLIEKAKEEDQPVDPMIIDLSSSIASTIIEDWVGVAVPFDRKIVQRYCMWTNLPTMEYLAFSGAKVDENFFKDLANTLPSREALASTGEKVDSLLLHDMAKRQRYDSYLESKLELLIETNTQP